MTGQSQKQKPKVQILRVKTMLAMIENSVLTKMFRVCYALVNGEEEEVLQNGNRSCAMYVSSILVLFKLMKEVQLTVHKAVADMETSGWVETKTLLPGCVLVWKEKEYGNGNPRRHIGFYVGNELAVSNDGNTGYPMHHEYKTYNGRGLEKIFSHPALSE